jgi:amino acid transporter
MKPAAPAATQHAMRRTISWTGALWVASGVPALVLFSIGGVGSVGGTAAVAIWAASVLMGFVQSFTYAEIATLFPNKAGGVSVYGAAAWLKYGKFLAPLSVWCNWIAWTPVLSLGCAIAAGYILNGVAPMPVAGSPEVAAWLADPANAGKTAEAAIAALTPALRTPFIEFDIGVVHIGIGMPLVIGAILMLIVLAIQHRGIRGTARVQLAVGLAAVITMLAVGIVPFVQGKVLTANLSPIAPISGAWDLGGWTLVLGGVFIAARSTYGFETAVCYTREFRDPARDTFKAILYSGLLCLLLSILLPFTFQGVLGVSGMTTPDVRDGTGVAAAMARMAGGGPTIEGILAVLMVLALVLAMMTAMAGSSRTLYQGSVDGWLPRYLSHVNRHGAPTGAMWTNVGVNLVLLAFAAADSGFYYPILAISTCGYIIFTFLSLNAGWLHRVDSGHIHRPFRAPTFILAIGAVLAFVNAFFMGAGAAVWDPDPESGPDPLWLGLIASALIIPVFWFRHYVQDRGKFPPTMLNDLGVTEGDLGERRAGALPYLVLMGGLAVLLFGKWLVG